MTRALLALLLLLPLAACNRPEAPQDVGVCWRASDGASDAAPKLSVLARGVDSLETCAVLLEGLRIEGQGDTDGAYQGYFIFVDDDGISSARHTAGFRYPIFQPPQRASIDKDLKQLIASDGGQLPDASQLTLDRK